MTTRLSSDRYIRLSCRNNRRILIEASEFLSADFFLEFLIIGGEGGCFLLVSGCELDAIFGRVLEDFGERGAEMLSIEPLACDIGVFSGLLAGIGPRFLPDRVGLVL